jgi:hypothetical protein
MRLARAEVRTPLSLPLCPCEGELEDHPSLSPSLRKQSQQWQTPPFCASARSTARAPTTLCSSSVFSGEVLTAFDELNVMQDKHTIRTIASGKSASFPATWKVTAAYHTPGTEIVGQTSNINERLINIDNLLIARSSSRTSTRPRTTSRPLRVRAPVRVASRERVGQERAAVGVLAARAAAAVTGAFGGTSLTSATTLYRTSATDLIAGINTAAQTMDEKDIPQDE